MRHSHLPPEEGGLPNLKSLASNCRTPASPAPSQLMDHLSKLENQSVYILREAFNKFEHLAMLWSIGKDSTVLLWLARKRTFGHVPFPRVHLDRSYKIPSMIEFRDRLAKEWNLKLIVGATNETLQSGATY